MHDIYCGIAIEAFNTYLTLGMSLTLVVISTASGMYFSTCSRTCQNSRLSLKIPFLAAWELAKSNIAKVFRCKELIH